MYAHTGAPTLNPITPSPSPPGTHHLHFMNYTAPNDARTPPYGNSPSYYAGPSGMSNSSVSHVNEAALPPPVSSQHSQATQLPPISSYVPTSRMPPPPLTLAGYGSSISSSSYERERERERLYRDLPPTPISAAEPRMKREILSQQ